MSYVRVLVFVLAFHQMRCMASNNVMCLTKKCLAAAAAAKQLEAMTSTTEMPTTESPTTENALQGIHFDSIQTQRINRFAKEILFVSV